MVADNHPRVGELERSVGIANIDGGIFRTGRPGSGHAMVDHEHPRLAELENHAVGIVNSGRGEAQWTLHPRTEERRPRTKTNTRSLSLRELLPEEVLKRVAAFSVNLGPGDVRATRIGQDTWTLLDRLDVLGILAAFAENAWATVRNRYDEWSTARQQARDATGSDEVAGLFFRRRPSLKDIFRAHGFIERTTWNGPPLLLEDYHDQRLALRRLCDATSSLLRSTVGDGWPSPAQFLVSSHDSLAAGAPGRLRNPQLRWSLRLRSGAQVRIKPWGAHGTDFRGAGLHQFEEYLYWSQVGEALSEAESEPFFLRWTIYFEGYANAELTGEVVEFLPPGTFTGLPPGPGNFRGEGGYLVRFPLPALPWTREQQGSAGQSPFWQVGEPVTELTTQGIGVSDEQVPPGGWRLTPEGATRLPDGQNVLLLEVPLSRLYVDVAAHTDANAWGGQTNTNPFETVLSGASHSR
eukprot:g16880.t1